MMQDIVEGSSVLFEDGPFYDVAGAVIDASSWAVKLHYRKPDGTAGSIDGTGTAAGLLQVTPAAGVLTPTGIWEARLEGIGGGARRYGDLRTFRVVPIVGFGS